jgi:hypothetical protein
MRWLVVALLGVTMLMGATPAAAAEIHVLSAGAGRSIVTDLAQELEKETGAPLAEERRQLGEHAAEPVLADHEPARALWRLGVGVPEEQRSGCR